MPSGSQVGGSTIWTGGAPSPSMPVPNRKGDMYIDYVTGKFYVAGGTSATTDWKLVTSA